MGASVILLRKLSDKLVNSLRYEVSCITDDGPVVDFRSVGRKVPVKKFKFTGNVVEHLFISLI